MFLVTRIARSLQNAIRPHVTGSPDTNAGPAAGVARVTARPRQVDEPTVPLPPVNQRYVSRRYPDVKRINRSNHTCAHRGTAREAVGL